MSNGGHGTMPHSRNAQVQDKVKYQATTCPLILLHAGVAKQSYQSIVICVELKISHRPDTSGSPK